MKRLITITLNCLIFLTASGSLFADNILLFGDRPGDRDALETSLLGLGHTVTNQAPLPVDLSGFDTVWHVSAFLPISPGDQAILATYLASGGGVHLTGERPCCEPLNDSLENFVNTVVVAGGLQVGDLGDINGPYLINPAALNGLATTPNTVSPWSPSAAGGMGGLGSLPDSNILATGSGDVPVGGAWAGGDLVSGQGQLTLLMDVNWFSSPLSPDNLAIVDNIQTFLNGDIIAPTGVARFRVTKTFSDGSDDEVDVMLTCNGGLPLVQDFSIAGGDPAGVTFVVTDLPVTGATCTVTESGGPAGYTPVLNGGAGCSWDAVSGGVRTCAISNEADPATFIVNKVWEVNEESGDEVIRVADITIICDAEIEGGYQDDDDDSEKELPGGIPMPPGFGDWMLDETIVGNGSAEATVDTSMGPATCWAEETIEQSGVESTDDCGPREIDAGETSECTFTNTVFFEGIPSLNQYGLAIMALLMLGMGMVGFRRFV